MLLVCFLSVDCYQLSLKWSYTFDSPPPQKHNTNWISITRSDVSLLPLSQWYRRHSTWRHFLECLHAVFMRDLSAVYLLFLYRGSDRFSYNIYSRALFTHSDWRQELSISQPWMKAHTVVSLPACRSGFWLRPTGHRSECISIIIPPLQSLGTDKPSGVKWFIDKICVAVCPSLLIWISTSEHAMENYY